jgi:bifunctional DNase/RNase
VVEVRLAAVRVDVQTKTPVVLLQERNGARTLPIFIGAQEARAIALVLEGHVPERPLTHDLIRDLLASLSARLDSVAITELREGIYFAELRVTAGGRELAVSCRPSDGVAVAVRTEAPIFVADDLLEREGFILEADEGDDDVEAPEELVDQFREFIEGIRPEDFA